MKRANIREVAELAGVSRQTVSRIINGRPGVRPDTQEKVQKVIDKLGYVATKTAKSLVSQKTNTIGLVLADISNPFFPGFARAVFDQGNKNGYNVLLCNSDNDMELEQTAILSLAKQPVDGIILFSNRADEEFLESIAKPYLPLVLINRTSSVQYTASVQSNNRRGGELAAKHLIDKGCGTFGYIGRDDPSKPDHDARRLLGFKRKLEENGYSLNDRNIELTEPSQIGGYEAARRLLKRNHIIDGLFCYSDIIAIGALRACKDVRIRVPNRLKIVGYDGISLGEFVDPKLTTVSLDLYGLGAMAFGQLQNLMCDPKEECQPIWIQPEILERETT